MHLTKSRFLRSESICTLNAELALWRKQRKSVYHAQAENTNTVYAVYPHILIQQDISILILYFMYWSRYPSLILIS